MLLNSSLPFRDKLNEFFYEGIDHQTSAYLFGSAATGYWVAGRSDLDLVVLVPKEKLNLLGEKIRSWTSTPGLPILDGYALSFYGDSPQAMRLEQFLRVTFPSHTNIELMDQWNIKNRSKYLFGKDSINSLFPDISHSDLKAWAIKDLKDKFSTKSLEVNLPETKVLLGLTWAVSWAARMLMLSRGTICESKREALQWLANEYAEIGSLVSLLLYDYNKSDSAPMSITSEQSKVLLEYCSQLMRQEVKITKAGQS